MDILHERQSLGQCQRHCWRSCWSKATGKARGYVGMYTCMKLGTSRHWGCLLPTFPHRLRSQPSCHSPPQISMLEDVRPQISMLEDVHEHVHKSMIFEVGCHSDCFATLTFGAWGDGVRQRTWLLYTYSFAQDWDWGMGRHGGTAHYYVCGTQVSIINIEIGRREDSKWQGTLFRCIIVAITSHSHDDAGKWTDGWWIIRDGRWLVMFSALTNFKNISHISCVHL